MGPYVVTVFRDRFGKKLEKKHLTPDELEALIRAAKPTRSKESGPLLKLAEFGDLKTEKGSLRHDENVLVVHGVIGDYDGEKMPMADGAARLAAAGLEAILHTSASHVPERPRWRVILFLSRGLSGGADQLKAQHRHWTGVLNAILGGVLKSESFALSQSYYFASVTGRHPVEVLRLRGACIDQLRDPPPPVLPISMNNDASTTRPRETTAPRPPDQSRSGELFAMIGFAIAMGWEEARVHEEFDGHQHALDQKDPYRAVQRCIDAHLKNPNVLIQNAQRLGGGDGDSAEAGSANFLPPPRENQPIEEAVVAELNKKHAVVTIGGNTRIMTTQGSLSVKGTIDLEFSHEADFKLRYSNRRHPVGFNSQNKPIVRTAAEIWLESPRRRQYDQVVFDPAAAAGPNDAERVYNLWRGFPYLAQPRGRGSWKKFRRFICETVCSGNAGYARWVEAWVARCLRSPWEPAQVAIILRGIEGVGKGFFANTVGDLYDPQHFISLHRREQLTGRFNAIMRDALLVFCDEAFFAGDPTIHGPLKTMITEPYVAIEHKGIDPVKFPNRRAFIMASNEDLVVPASMQARRWAVFNVADGHANDRRYFGAIKKEMAAGGYAAMMHDLVGEDFSDVDPFTPPRTAALAEQKQLSLHPAERLIFDWLTEGRVPAAGDRSGGAWPLDKRIAVDHAAAKFCFMQELKEQRAHGADLRSAETTLGLALKKLFPDLRDERPTIGGERRRVWVLPSLAEARAAVSRLLGPEFRWDDGPTAAPPNKKPPKF